MSNLRAYSESLIDILRSAHASDGAVLSDVESAAARACTAVATHNIEALDREIDELVLKRTQEKETLQTLASALAPIKRIPSEVLAEIFVQELDGRHVSLNEPRKSGTPWSLLQVCRRWRHVALTELRLWNRMTVYTESWYQAPWRQLLDIHIHAPQIEFFETMHVLQRIRPTGDIPRYNEGPWDMPVSIADDAISLPRLRHLRLWRYTEAILQPLILPSLTSLQIEDVSQVFDATPIIRMVERSQCVLTEFSYVPPIGALRVHGRLIRIGTDRDLFHPLLVVFPCLQELRMPYCIFPASLLDQVARAELLPVIVKLKCGMGNADAPRFADLVERRLDTDAPGAPLREPGRTLREATGRSFMINNPIIVANGTATDYARKRIVELGKKHGKPLKLIVR
ncbi:hypothetical protein FPV67DRAFT_1530174 [Lyophyllum atratum]|nr:hypothetical protein FPV67DRAFT_1530174 [Lyophyllum atratum]